MIAPPSTLVRDIGDTSDVAVVILAAGQGTRFRSDTAKVLHQAAGRSLLGHVIEAVRPLDVGQVVVVVGHQAEQVAAEAQDAGIDGLTTVVQHEQRGTGHAVQQAMPALATHIRRVLVLFGDTPLLTAPVLAGLFDATKAAPAALLTTEAEDPTGYGRILRTTEGSVRAIVEHRDATAEQRQIREINAGMCLIERQRLERGLAGLGADNEQGELYLTDVIGFLHDEGDTVVPVLVPEEFVAGVNDRAQLTAAAAVLRERRLDHLMREVGVSVMDPATTYVDVDVEVGRDTVLLPGTILDAGTRIGERASIGPNSHLSACVVGDDATVHSTRAVEADIGADAAVGPFAHLRPGTRLEARTKAGAFVETKNATLEEGAKAGHLAYVGDATVGRDVNVGCGVVFVNYDGTEKHHTTVEQGSFVGSGTMLVAPVTVGEGAYIAAGSTITDDVPPDALAIARARQSVKPGWAKRRREEG